MGASNDVMRSEVERKASAVSGLGIALAIVGWTGFVFAAGVEIALLIDTISASLSVWDRIGPLATLELVWVCSLALAGAGHSMQLCAAYGRSRSGATS